jgi:hypothetical protein
VSKHFLSLAIIILSLSLLFCGYQISKDAVNNDAKKTTTVLDVEKGLWTMEETAQYLSLPVDQLRSIVSSNDFERANLSGSYDTYRFIPYIEIKGEKYFNRIQVDEWIKYNSLNWTEVAL